MTNDERLRFVPEPALAAGSLADGFATAPGPEPVEADIEALTKAIRVIAQAIDTRSKAISRASGLTIPQIVVMQAVRVRGEVTTSLLSRHCHLSAGTVVSILDKLEERGFVERYRNAVDRRIVHTRLTEAGDVALAAAPTLLPPTALDALAHLAPREREGLVASFRTVAALLRGNAGEAD
ncbi:MarR family winged helix-turn-helix transcriptional regulator [Salinarimonas sp. NSM]|uniref:MarR family winged helix-turn-helix transcriptional regulator n=1 Tax=Salinarimonas sp. NSM TaxID=3458003 RepID=UPI004035B125